MKTTTTMVPKPRGRPKGYHQPIVHIAVTESTLTRMSLAQLAFLRQLHEADKKFAFSISSASAGAVRSLYRKGWIRPFGQVGTKQRWQLVVELSSSQLALIAEIIDADAATGSTE